MLLWTLIGAVAAAQAAADRHVDESGCQSGAVVDMLILGSYHMDNPGLDAVNIEADDVLQPRRQREIDELNRKLLRFRPTKVAVEGDFSSSTWKDRYQAYLKGAPLGRNEIEQIGMKVARIAGHETIYPIDFPMMMSGLRYDEVRIKPSPKTAGPAQRQLSEAELKLRRQSVSENLRELNDPAAIARSHAPYMDLLIPDPDNAALYEKSDYLLNWYKRNIRMMTNIARISEPGDRVLVIVGAGHLPILRDFAGASPHICLMDTAAYLD